MQFMPLRLNFFIFVALALLIYSFISENKADTSSFYGFLILMSKIAVWLIIILLSISFISTLIAYFYYRRSGNKLNLHFFEKNMRWSGKKIRLHASIPNIFKPILGSVSTRFIYNNLDLSQKFILHKKNNRTFLTLKPGVASATTINFPDIKEYQFKGALIYFEDLFRFFSLTSFTNLNEQFSNLPKKMNITDVESEPKATDAEDIRIKKLRRVNGEWLEYKKFESADDVRRIVWKVFAKSRELMVRKQEILNPFASHIYFYLSFYNDNEKSYLHPSHLQLMANYYKNVGWSIYDELLQQEFEIKLIADQIIKPNHATAEKSQRAAEKIALCDWQQDNHVQDWFDPRKGSVIILHSLISSHDMEELLEKCDEHTKIFYVDLSKPFESSLTKNWIKYIFLIPKQDALSQLQQTWPLSPMKYLLMDNHKKNLALLKEASAEIEII
jgi:hypothetical protein